MRVGDSPYSVPGWSEWVGRVSQETLHLVLVAQSNQPKTEEPGRQRRAPECGAKCGGQKESLPLRPEQDSILVTLEGIC